MTDTITAMGNDLKNYAYNIMKEHLINCTYAPGSILNEAHLTAGLKLSLHPRAGGQSAVWKAKAL